VENLVSIELAYINTKHPDFQREASIVSSMMHAHIDDNSAQKLTVKQASKKYSLGYASSSNHLNGEMMVKEVCYLAS
jgi:hypothetical protein